MIIPGVVASYPEAGYNWDNADVSATHSTTKEVHLFSSGDNVLYISSRIDSGTTFTDTDGIIVASDGTFSGTAIPDGVTSGDKWVGLRANGAGDGVDVGVNYLGSPAWSSSVTYDPVTKTWTTTERIAAGSTYRAKIKGDGGSGLIIAVGTSGAWGSWSSPINLT